jgi:hypothetical protein
MRADTYVLEHVLIFTDRWIAGKITEILGSEDDIVIELCFNLIEGSRFVSLPDAKILTCD